MAIKNASDLLVYKKSPANVAQVTRIRVKSSSPLDGTGSLLLYNQYDSTGTYHQGPTTLNISTNDGVTILNTLEGHWGSSYWNYTISSQVTDGDYIYVDFTSAIAQDNITAEILNGTAEIENGGVEVIVIQSGETLDGQEPIAHSTSASISFNNDLRDITSKDSGGYQENAGGLRSFELSSDALQDINADLDFKEFYDDVHERNEVIVRFAERDSGVKWEGSGFISSLSMDAGVEENVTYSVTITGTGVVTKGTY